MSSVNNPFINSPRNEDDFWESSEITVIDDKRWTLIGRRYNMTRRELQVARLICRGLDNRHIARALNIKEGTVKTHIRNIYRRLNVQNRIAMFLKFIRFAAQFVGDDGHQLALPIIVEYTSNRHIAHSSEMAK